MNSEFKLITRENIETEHICCAFSDKKCVEGYQAKKDLISERIGEQFHFIKLDERGKVFIEFVPAEFAWAPVDADDYIFIHCFWVSGKFKGQGYAKKLLQECENFAKKNNKKGIVAVCSDKKKPFISDKKFFISRGFEVCDKAEPYFEMVVKKFDPKYEDPCFKENAKKLESNFKDGVEVIYSDLCPFNDFH
ncbi:MAG: GNAT family N-acetyltransferase, partial [Rhodothermaceae bacterium]